MLLIWMNSRILGKQYASRMYTRWFSLFDSIITALTDNALRAIKKFQNTITTHIRLYTSEAMLLLMIAVTILCLMSIHVMVALISYVLFL